MTAMTEEEAREKRCCGPEGCGVRKGHPEHGPVRYCVASECMAWEGSARPCSHCGGDGFDSYHMCERKACPMWSDAENPAALRKDHGFCALAGGPAR